MLPQERYVKITTGKGTATIASRNLKALVITDIAAKTGKTFDADHDITCYSIADVADAFDSTTEVYKWAAMYFSYSDPNGNSPTSLTIAKMVSDDASPKSAFERISGRTNAFGMFAFVTSSAITVSEVKEVAVYNAGLNYKFEFITSITLSDINEYANETDPIKALKTALVGADGSSGTHIVYQKSAGVPKTYILAAVLSSIDWDMEEGTVSPMFRSLSGETADVISADSTKSEGSYTDIGANDLDKLDISYYGQVQINGIERGFYQKGMNSDGESALVFMGEVWIKSEISSRILSLMLSLPKIKANAEGDAKIYTTVVTVCTDAVSNGSIEVGKELDNTQRTAIFSVTRDTEAADIITERGWWLKTWIDPDDDGKNYKAKYLLLYSKEDVVVKVEGSDIIY